MEAPRGPTIMPWKRGPIVIKHGYRDFKRWLRKDKSTVSCIADLILPPPPYEAVRSSPPQGEEVWILHRRLNFYKRQLYFERGIEREMLKVDIEQLGKWIEQMEYLIYWVSATTIPARYRHEPIKDRILKRIRKLRGEDPNKPTAKAKAPTPARVVVVEEDGYLEEEILQFD